MLKRRSPFLRTPLAQQVADMAEPLHTRPSVLLGIEGSPLEMLLWDISVLGQKTTVEVSTIVSASGDPRGLTTVRDKILAKRRRLGIPRYIS